MHILGLARQYVDLSLFLMRVMVAMIFGTNGFHHLQSPQQRAASLGMNVALGMFVGVTEIAAALGMVLGVFTTWAAFGLIILLLGTIFMKAIKWKNGFWGEDSLGWHYDLMLLCMNLVILCTGGGRYVLLQL